MSAKITIERFVPLIPLKGKVVFIKATVVSESLNNGSIVVKMADFQEKTEAGNIRLNYGDTFVLVKKEVP